MNLLEVCGSFRPNQKKQKQESASLLSVSRSVRRRSGQQAERRSHRSAEREPATAASMLASSSSSSLWFFRAASRPPASLSAKASWSVTEATGKTLSVRGWQDGWARYSDMKSERSSCCARLHSCFVEDRRNLHTGSSLQLRHYPDFIVTTRSKSCFFVFFFSLRTFYLLSKQRRRWAPMLGNTRQAK